MSCFTTDCYSSTVLWSLIILWLKAMPLYHAIFDENKNHYNQHWSSDSSSPPLCHTPHKSDKLLPTAYTVISGLKLKSLLIKLHIDSKKNTSCNGCQFGVTTTLQLRILLCCCMLSYCNIANNERSPKTDDYVFSIPPFPAILRCQLRKL